MGLESLFIFTLLGGMAAGAYVFETCLRREREGGRPWLLCLVVVILFAVAMLAALMHVHHYGRIFGALGSGTVNLGASMTREVAAAACFLLLAVIDLIVIKVKGAGPFALRVVTAIVGVVCMLAMGAAYIDAYGNPVWCNAPATVVSFLGGDLAMGLALWALLDRADYSGKALRNSTFAVAAVLAVGICLELAAYASAGLNAALQAVALVVAPVAAAVLVALSSKFKDNRTLAIIVFVVVLVGVAISRWSFYATFGA